MALLLAMPVVHSGRRARGQPGPADQQRCPAVHHWQPGAGLYRHPFCRGPCLVLRCHNFNPVGAFCTILLRVCLFDVHASQGSDHICINNSAFCASTSQPLAVFIAY
eukprot:scaffold90451_cov24-Prasinocladus_malaysianus.AAC.1